MCRDVLPPVFKNEATLDMSLLLLKFQNDMRLFPFSVKEESAVFHTFQENGLHF